MRRRSSPRVKVRQTKASVRKKGFLFSTGKKETVEVVDIGSGGLCFITEENPSEGSKYDVVINLPDGHSINTVVIVRRVERVFQRYKVGAEFKGLSSPDQDLLYGSNLLGICGISVHNTDMAMGERLRTIRTAMGLTRTELSEITGVPHDTIVAIEVGTELAPSDTVVRVLARGLGMERRDFR